MSACTGQHLRKKKLLQRCSAGFSHGELIFCSVSVSSASIRRFEELAQSVCTDVDFGSGTATIARTAWAWHSDDLYKGGFHSHGGTPIAGWFIREKPIKMNDLGVPLFQETTIKRLDIFRQPWLKTCPGVSYLSSIFSWPLRNSILKDLFLHPPGVEPQRASATYMWTSATCQMLKGGHAAVAWKN